MARRRSAPRCRRRRIPWCAPGFRTTASTAVVDEARPSPSRARRRARRTVHRTRFRGRLARAPPGAPRRPTLEERLYRLGALRPPRLSGGSALPVMRPTTTASCSVDWVESFFGRDVQSSYPTTPPRGVRRRTRRTRATSSSSGSVDGDRSSTAMLRAPAAGRVPDRARLHAARVSKSRIRLRRSPLPPRTWPFTAVSPTSCCSQTWRTRHPTLSTRRSVSWRWPIRFASTSAPWTDRKAGRVP